MSLALCSKAVPKLRCSKISGCESGSWDFADLSESSWTCQRLPAHFYFSGKRVIQLSFHLCSVFISMNFQLIPCGYSTLDKKRGKKALSRPHAGHLCMRILGMTRRSFFSACNGRSCPSLVVSTCVHWHSRFLQRRAFSAQWCMLLDWRKSQSEKLMQISFPILVMVSLGFLFIAAPAQRRVRAQGWRCDVRIQGMKSSRTTNLSCGSPKKV